MGLESIKKDILDNAKKETARIEAETALRIKEIEESSNKRIEEIKAEIGESTKRRLAQITSTKTAEAKENISILLLEKKRVLIDAAISEAKMEIIGSHNEQLLKKLLAKATKELGDIDKVYCRKEDIPLLNEVKTIPKDIGGGIIAENKDGMIQIDYSYDSILSAVKDKHLQEIAEALFK